MTTLWFVMPAHGRVDLARICMRQLALTCRALHAFGIEASAVVVALDENLDTAADLGFATKKRDNAALGRKWNDGYQLAGRVGVDYVVPIGSDDWIWADFIAAGLPGPGEIRCARQSAIVDETGTRLARLRIPYDGGDGVRVIPTELLRPFNYRPAVEDASRAIDTSVWMRLKRTAKFTYHDVDPLQIVDFKSDTQLNSYERVSKYREGEEHDDPWSELALLYPEDSVSAMRDFYATRVP